MRIVIELKRGGIAEVVLNQLYKLTPMQATFGIIMLAIVDGQPRVLTLKELLSTSSTTARRWSSAARASTCARPRSARTSAKASLKALDNLDEVIAAPSASRDATPRGARAA